jgi:hypothetical protein
MLREFVVRTLLPKLEERIFRLSAVVRPRHSGTLQRLRNFWGAGKRAPLAGTLLGVASASSWSIGSGQAPCTHMWWARNVSHSYGECGNSCHFLSLRFCRFRVG